MNFHSLLTTPILVLYTTLIPAQDLSDEFLKVYRSYEEAFTGNELEKATTLAEQALNMAVEQIGPEHDKSAVLMINLGHVLMLTGKIDEADKHLRQAEKIITGKLGENHDSLVTVHEDLAIILANRNNFEEARKELGKAISVRISNNGPDDPLIVNLLRSQAQIDVADNKIDSAGELLMQAIGIIEKNYGVNDPRATLIIASLGDIAFIKQDFADAENLYTQALKLFEEKLQNDDPRIVSMHAKLAEFYITRKSDKYSEHADKVIALVKTEEAIAQPLFIVKPVLPPLDGEQHQGSVLIEFNITETGKVSDPKIIESEPVDVYNKASMDAILKWRFIPKTENGKRVQQTNTRARIVIQGDKVDVHFGELG